MEPPEGSTSKPPEKRAKTATGFDEPYYRERIDAKHGRWYRFFGLETSHSMVTWRPKKAPGPKMSAFLVMAVGTVGGYLYDRRQAKKLKEGYIDQVRWMAAKPIKWSDEQQERIDVYAAHIPEDAESDRPIVYFKKYVKPILNAAGYDYTFTSGQIPGSIARILLARFKLHRLEEAASIPRPTTDPPPSGLVFVGRNTLKEYLWALKKGYVDEIDLDRESRIAEGDLETIESQEIAAQVDKDGLFPSFIPSDEQPSTSRFLPEAASIPPQPPFLFLPFSHPLGTMIWWPKKLTNWLWGERRRVEEGAVAAFTLLAGRTREIQPPASAYAEGLYHDDVESARQWLTEDRKMAVGKGDDVWSGRLTGSEDLDADLASERYITSAYKKAPQSVQGIRKHYYEELQSKLALARQLASGEVEPTKEQQADPPPTEEFLHEERTRREKTWRREEQGFRLIRPGSGITWHDAFQTALRVYTPVSTPPVQDDASPDGL